MKRRRNELPKIPPFIDFYGRPTFENPAGQYRPNPAVTAPVQPIGISEPVVTTQAQAAAANAADAVANVERDEARLRAELADVLARHQARPASVPVPEPVHAGVSLAEVTPITRAQRTAERRNRTQRRVRRGVAAAVAVGSGLVGITGAAAMWTNHGSGAGAAKAASMQALTFGAATTSGTALLPGSTPGNLTTPGGTLTLNITNPNPFAVNITSVTQAGIVTVDATHQSAGCTSDTGTWPGSVVLGSSGVSIPLKSSLSVSVASGTHTVTIADAAKMLTTSANKCQGATFTVPVTITVAQP